MYLSIPLQYFFPCYHMFLLAVPTAIGDARRHEEELRVSINRAALLHRWVLRLWRGRLDHSGSLWNNRYARLSRSRANRLFCLWHVAIPVTMEQVDRAVGLRVRQHRFAPLSRLVFSRRVMLTAKKRRIQGRKPLCNRCIAVVHTFTASLLVAASLKYTSPPAR